MTLGTLLYWSNIETGLALIATCLPTLHLILTRSAFSHVFSVLSSAMMLTSGRSDDSSPAHSKVSAEVSNVSISSSNASHRDHYEQRISNQHAGYQKMDHGADFDYPSLHSPAKAHSTLGLNSSTDRMV